MNLPPKGICVDCKWEKARDGDTVELRLRTGQTIAVRLLGINCPEKNTQEGQDAKHFLESLLEENDNPLSLWLPPLKDTDGDGILDVKEILSQMTFDRVPGVLFIGTQDVGGILIRHGHAATLKGYK